MLRERAGRRPEMSGVELMRAFLAQIERSNPLVNAMPTLLPEEELLQAARAADRGHRARRALGPLHGLPIAIKDVNARRAESARLSARRSTDFIPTRTSSMWSAAGRRAQ